MRIDTKPAHWPFAAVSGLVPVILNQSLESVKSTAQTHDDSIFVVVVWCVEALVATGGIEPPTLGL
jgi:hypothetical protein